MNNQNETFRFNLSSSEKITPNYLQNSQIETLIKTNNIQELNKVLIDMSQENFDQNTYFDLSDNEKKLIKDYQILVQYMLYSINGLTRKNQLLNDLSNQKNTEQFNLENEIDRQQQKINSQQETLSQLTNNLLNLEFLIKELKLVEEAKNYGIEIKDNEDDNNENN